MLALCGFLLAWAQLAHGHAALLESEPADGMVLSSAPSAATLSFNEPVGPLAFKLVVPDGSTLEPGPVESLNDRVRIALPASTAHGTYLLSWRVVSADGHPVGGVLSYALGEAGPIVNTQAAEPNIPRDTAIWASRLLLYLCLIAGTGAALFRATAPGAPRQDWVRRVIPAGVVLLLISLALQGLDALDAPWQSLARADTWRAAFDTRYAGTLGFAALALAAAYRTQDSHRPWVQRTAALASAVLLGVALANSGHASTAPPQWLSQPAVALHIITVTLWLGALIPLARLLRANTDTLPAALARFSRWITSVVGLLVLSGATLVWLQLDAVSDLWRTPYGLVLSAKLALVAALLLLAAVNRFRYTRPVLAGDAPARQGLLRVIGLEIVVAVCILGLVSLWRFTPPPRSVHAAQTGVSAQAPAPIQTMISGPQAHASLRYQPGGQNLPGALLIDLTAIPADTALAAQAVTVTLSNPASGIEALDRDATRAADGSWRATLPPLPRIDGWQVRLDIRVDDFDQVTLEGPLAGLQP